MRISRIPSGRALAILGALGASLTLGAPVLAADTVPLIPPAHQIPAAVKQTPPPAHAQTQPLIPPATLPSQSSQLSAPPQPREPLPLQTNLLPLAAPAAAPTPPKQPAS
ncbi:MAG TPA: hypothetical protein VN808_07590 [Stellaceae bacterium]|nr:hypothetical protein [Stellaceae bacterium]